MADVMRASIALVGLALLLSTGCEVKSSGLPPRGADAGEQGSGGTAAGERAPGATDAQGVGDGSGLGGVRTGAAAAGGSFGRGDAGRIGGTPSSGGGAGGVDAAWGRNVQPDGYGPENLTLTWSDEFDDNTKDGLDPNTWRAATQFPEQLSGELQMYTDRRENVFLDGEGNLVIRALDETYHGYPYTSGRVETKGRFLVRPGHRIVVSAKLPAGKGSVASMSLLGTNGPRPQSGELALVEQWGQDKSCFYVFALADSTDEGSTGKIRHCFPEPSTASTDFHRYILDWYPDQLVFQVDDHEIVRQPFVATSPFYSIPEYLVLSVVIGGGMGGKVDAKGFPMDMTINYVHVYEL